MYITVKYINNYTYLLLHYYNNQMNLIKYYANYDNYYGSLFMVYHEYNTLLRAY